MAGNDNPPADSGNNDICSIFASFINERQTMERLLNWMRHSQTTCTDSSCFDDLNTLPGTLQSDPQGATLGASSTSDTLVMVVTFIFALLTIYAMNLTRNRDLPASKSNQSNHHGTSQDDHNRYRRRDGGDDDSSRPQI